MPLLVDNLSLTAGIVLVLLAGYVGGYCGYGWGHVHRFVNKPDQQTDADTGLKPGTELFHSIAILVYSGASLYISVKILALWGEATGLDRGISILAAAGPALLLFRMGLPQLLKRETGKWAWNISRLYTQPTTMMPHVATPCKIVSATDAKIYDESAHKNRRNILNRYKLSTNTDSSTITRLKNDTQHLAYPTEAVKRDFNKAGWTGLLLGTGILTTLLTINAAYTETYTSAHLLTKWAVTIILLVTASQLIRQWSKHATHVVTIGSLTAAGALSIILTLNNSTNTSITPSLWGIIIVITSLTYATSGALTTLASSRELQTRNRNYGKAVNNIAANVKRANQQGDWPTVIWHSYERVAGADNPLHSMATPYHETNVTKLAAAIEHCQTLKETPETHTDIRKAVQIEALLKTDRVPTVTELINKIEAVIGIYQTTQPHETVDQSHV